MSQFFLDPDARFARVATDEQMRRLLAVRQRPHEGRPEPSDCRAIERIRSGDAAHTVSAEEPRDGQGVT